MELLYTLLFNATQWIKFYTVDHFSVGFAGCILNFNLSPHQQKKPTLTTIVLCPANCKIDNLSTERWSKTPNRIVCVKYKENEIYILCPLTFDHDNNSS